MFRRAGDVCLRVWCSATSCSRWSCFAGLLLRRLREASGA